MCQYDDNRTFGCLMRIRSAHREPGGGRAPPPPPPTIFIRIHITSNKH